MKIKKINKCNIGGQAVMEGVMMRGESSMATAVRDEEGVIRLETQRLKPLKERSVFFRLPIIRGVINFFTSLVFGTKILMRSAEVMGDDEEPTAFEKWLAKTFKVDIYDVVLSLGVILGLALSVFLFVVTPQIVTGLINELIKLPTVSVWFNLIEGGVRILIFIGYILLSGLIKDVKRTYMYHGAEHKTISCYEYGWDLTVENVRKSSRVHERCGTTFMFFVMMISILVFSLANSFIGAQGVVRVLVKIALLPLVAGLSYELLKGLAKTDFFLFDVFKAPGLLLQRITTKEPTDDMIECAITAFKTVLEMDADPSIKPQKFVIAAKTEEVLNSVKERLAAAGVTEDSESEWILCRVLNVKRSELSGVSKISAKNIDSINEIVEKRVTGMPLWYVFGDADFYGYTFKVDERALIPRPETEELVALALKTLTDKSVVLDMCTGSGAIAIAINKECGARVVAADVSCEALSLAKENALSLGADVTFIKSDMFENIQGEYDMIVSNPPYIKSGDIPSLSKELAFEPSLALDGGADGLDFYRIIAARSKGYLKENGVLLLECGYDQKEALIDLFKDFSSVECIKDMNGNDRIIKAVK